jgi:tRNA-dihydrouridine synthase 2
MDAVFPRIIPKGANRVVVLAPMVRAGSLALRSLALDFGCYLVWSEELIDFKLADTRRVVNEALETVDFLVDYPGKTVVLFRTHAREKGRVILQLGTGSPASALKAAKHVEGDVAGIDVNMGCPKKFSIQGGMGAALLENQEVACEIIRTLSSNLSIPVTAKIRIVNTMEETITFIKKLQEAGAAAVTVHLRTKGDTESSLAGNWEVMREIVDTEGIRVPILANGDMYTRARINEMCEKGGCAGVMLARPFLFDASVVRAEGPMDQQSIMRSFMKACLKYDVVHQVIKYTLMEMIVNRRHPPPILSQELPTAGRYTTADPIWKEITRAKSTKDLCTVLNMQTEYAAVYGEHGDAASASRKSKEKRPIGEKGEGGEAAAKKLRKESDTLSHPAHFDDAYFEKTGAYEVVVPADPGIGREYDIVVADPSHARDIVAVTNDAYVADRFFKYPEYYDRFSLEDVQNMQKEDNSCFLVARMTKDGAVAGSLYLTVTSSTSAGDDKTTVTIAEGNFGAVAVSRKYEKRGIGKNLIEAAATFTRKRRAQLQSGKKPGEERVQAKLTMGVINLREDLFGWYGRQGFVKGEEIRPNNAELQRICLPELDTCLVQMHKDLD